MGHGFGLVKGEAAGKLLATEAGLEAGEVAAAELRAIGDGQRCRSHSGLCLGDAVACRGLSLEVAVTGDGEGVASGVGVLNAACVIGNIQAVDLHRGNALALRISIVGQLCAQGDLCVRNALLGNGPGHVLGADEVAVGGDGEGVFSCVGAGVLGDSVGNLQAAHLYGINALGLKLPVVGQCIAQGDLCVRNALLGNAPGHILGAGEVAVTGDGELIVSGVGAGVAGNLIGNRQAVHHNGFNGLFLLFPVVGQYSVQGDGCARNALFGDGHVNALGFGTVVVAVALDHIPDFVASGIGTGGDGRGVFAIFGGAVEHGTVFGSARGHQRLRLAIVDQAVCLGGGAGGCIGLFDGVACRGSALEVALAGDGHGILPCVLQLRHGIVGRILVGYLVVAAGQGQIVLACDRIDHRLLGAAVIGGGGGFQGERSHRGGGDVRRGGSGLARELVVALCRAAECEALEADCLSDAKIGSVKAGGAGDDGQIFAVIVRGQAADVRNLRASRSVVDLTLHCHINDGNLQRIDGGCGAGLIAAFFQDVVSGAFAGENRIRKRNSLVLSGVCILKCGCHADGQVIAINETVNTQLAVVQGYILGAVIVLVLGGDARECNLLGADGHIQLPNCGIVVVAIALDHVVDGVGSGIFPFGDSCTVAAVDQSIEHGTARRSARSNQLLITAIVGQGLRLGAFADFCLGPFDGKALDRSHGQLIVPGFLALDASDLRVIAARIGPFSGYHQSDDITIFGSFGLGGGLLGRAVVGQLRIAPIDANGLLGYYQGTIHKIDVVIVGGQAAGSDLVVAAHITVLLVAVRKFQLTIKCAVAIHKAFVADAIVSGYFAIEDHSVFGSDSERLLTNGNRGTIAHRVVAIHRYLAEELMRTRVKGVQLQSAAGFAGDRLCLRRFAGIGDHLIPLVGSLFAIGSDAEGFHITIGHCLCRIRLSSDGHRHGQNRYFRNSLRVTAVPVILPGAVCQPVGAAVREQVGNNVVLRYGNRAIAAAFQLDASVK